MTPLWSRVQLVNPTCILIQPLTTLVFTSASIATLVTDSLLCTPQHRSDTSYPRYSSSLINPSLSTTARLLNSLHSVRFAPALIPREPTRVISKASPKVEPQHFEHPQDEYHFSIPCYP
jgi:hypothetical protein